MTPEQKLFFDLTDWLNKRWSSHKDLAIKLRESDMQRAIIHNNIANQASTILDKIAQLEEKYKND